MPYRHVIVIDGNDGRGIDVGLMTAEGYPIGPMRRHVDDRLPNGNAVFSRDCPEYSVTTPPGPSLWRAAVVEGAAVARLSCGRGAAPFTQFYLAEMRRKTLASRQ